MRNLPVMGPLWFTAQWIPVPWVYSPPGHTPWPAPSLCPPGCLHHTWAYDGNPPNSIVDWLEEKTESEGWRMKERVGQKKEKKRAKGKEVQTWERSCWALPRKPCLFIQKHAQKNTFKWMGCVLYVCINTFTHSCTLQNHKSTNACILCVYLRCMHAWIQTSTGLLAQLDGFLYLYCILALYMAHLNNSDDQFSVNIMSSHARRLVQCDECAVEKRAGSTNLIREKKSFKAAWNYWWKHSNYIQL